MLGSFSLKSNTGMSGLRGYLDYRHQLHSVRMLHGIHTPWFISRNIHTLADNSRNERDVNLHDYGCIGILDCSIRSTLYTIHTPHVVQAIRAYSVALAGAERNSWRIKLVSCCSNETTTPVDNICSYRKYHPKRKQHDTP